MRLEEVRMPGELHPRIRIMAFSQDLNGMADPADQIHRMLENKRNYSPPRSPSARILASNPEWDWTILTVADNMAHRFQPGDPVVVLADGHDDVFAIVDKSFNNQVELSHNPGFYVPTGSILQNLRLTVIHPDDQIGLCTQMQRPEPVVFSVTTAGDGFLVVVNPPTVKKAKVFDVYVRTKNFSQIGEYWWPDAMDIPFDQDQVVVKTFGGGIAAGGGLLVPESAYFVTVVGKDRRGFSGTIESAPHMVDQTIFV